MQMLVRWIAISACWTISGLALLAEETVVTAPAKAAETGRICVHRVSSPFQDGETEIHVLLPSEIDSERRYRVVYVLPVEAARNDRYGRGLAEVERLGLHDKHQAIFVAPTFSQLPWYADHPCDPAIRQESYLLKTVLALVERDYPAQNSAAGRLLLGFSKSGWGAWSLLLRHPQTFGRAAAWDAPLMMDAPGKYGSDPIFGTSENFSQYQISTLVRTRPQSFDGATRLLLSGYGNFRSAHQEMHRLLLEAGIPHVYRDGPQRSHDWHSGWVAEAVKFLLSPDEPASAVTPRAAGP